MLAASVLDAPLNRSFHFLLARLPLNRATWPMCPVMLVVRHCGTNMTEPEEFSLEYFLETNKEVFDSITKRKSVASIGVCFEFQIDKKKNLTAFISYLSSLGLTVQYKKIGLWFIVLGYMIDAEKHGLEVNLESIQLLTKQIYDIGNQHNCTMTDCLLSYK